MRKKKRYIISCENCNAKNDVNLALENDDYEVDKIRKGVIYIYCCQCGNCIEIKDN